MIESERRRRGFTLVELLVVTAILSLVALAIVSTFGAGLKVYSRARGYGVAQRDVLFSLEKLETDLRNTFKFSTIDFIGDSKKVSFVGLAGGSDAMSHKDLFLTRISYSFNDKTGFLVREQQAYSGDGNSRPLARIENIALSYCLFDLNAHKYSWRDSWTVGSGIPAAVKIRITFKDINRNAELSRIVFVPASG